MAYNNFTLDGLIQQFGLQIVSKADVFARAAAVDPSRLLVETLTDFMPLALQISTEKSRSEFIIAPVLADTWRQFKGEISLFSGVDFTVDAEAGLSGVCDYLFSLTPLQLVVQAPVVAVVEAKNDNIKTGMGQCMAEMLAAQRFNERRGLPLPVVYGVVTSGSAWKFMSLREATVTVDETEYHIEQLATILGILAFMVREALEQQGGIV
ncbi:MAG: hypothetical protein ACRYFS_00245 [Janthinobacterium lividum]